LKSVGVLPVLSGAGRGPVGFRGRGIGFIPPSAPLDATYATGAEGGSTFRVLMLTRASGAAVAPWSLESTIIGVDEVEVLLGVDLLAAPFTATAM
jgi:hypothetical protein